ncbi:N/A [soil metagenome]
MNTDSGELKLHFLDYWRVFRVRLPLIILVFLLVVITASVITYLTPKQFASTVTMQVKQNDSMQVFNQSGGMGMDPRFITTQFEIIQRKEILYPVIETLGLDKKWGTTREGAYQMLRYRGVLVMQEIRNTELIQIVVYNTDAKLAADIANAIAEEYRHKRNSELDESVTKDIDQLKSEIAKQQAKVDELKELASKLRVENGINDPSPDTIEETSSLYSDLVKSVGQQVSTKELEVAAARAKYAQVASMTDDQIMRSLTTLEIQDPTVASVLPQYQEADSELARMLNSGLGPNHPNVKSLRAKRDVMEKQLKDQVVVLRKTLKTNLDIAEDALKNLHATLVDAQQKQQDASTKFAPYYEAKNNYLNARKLLEAAQMKVSTTSIEKQMPAKPTIIWEKAEPASGPSKPNVVLNIALSIGVGLVFGVGLAFFIEYLDTSVKTMEDIESFLQVPVLAVVPKNISMLINEPPDNPDAEAYRIMRTNIEFNRKNPDASTVTIVSGGTGEGKSTTMSNIAFTFARGGYSTLIVDADLRRPSQHRIFGVGNETGLTDYLTSDIELEEVVLQTKIDNLYLLTSGKLPSDAVGILNSQRMVEFIEEVKSRFDIIFFDSPPILGVSDASVLCSAVDLTIIVVQHRRFPRAMLQRVKQAVLNVGGNILGVVLNNVDVRHDQHYEYYTSYYNYYYQKPGREQAKKPARQTVASAPETPSSNDGDSY